MNNISIIGVGKLGLCLALNLEKKGYNSGYYIFGLGASTKGNVLLQYCNLGDLIHEIGEINPKKFNNGNNNHLFLH